MAKKEMLKCSSCGGDIKIKNGKHTCIFCGNVYEDYESLILEDSVVVELNMAIIKKKFFKFADALELYDAIIEKNSSCEQAYWGALLSEYGIEYVKDYDGTCKPTCHRTSERSVTKSKYYEALSDEHKKQAKEIEELRLAVQKKVQSLNAEYDVFICYKQTEEDKRPTPEATWARDIYDVLTQKGFRVFYAEKSLAKSNMEYEPHIYAALKSAKMMFVLASSVEHVNSAWVKNEWSRFVGMIKDGDEDKVLRVVYNPANLDMYDLHTSLQTSQGINHEQRDWDDIVVEAAEDCCYAKARIKRKEFQSVSGKKKKAVNNVDALSTIELGNNKVEKRGVNIQQIEKRKSAGRDYVPIASTDREILDGAWRLLNNGRFPQAGKQFERLLINGNNAEAILGCILVSIKANDDNHFAMNAEKFKKENFDWFEKCIDCADKNLAERVLNLLLNSTIQCIKDGEIKEAIGFYKQLVKFEAEQGASATDKVFDAIMQRDFTSLEFEMLITAYLESIEGGSLDNYLEKINLIVERLISLYNFALAKKYNDKVLEVDAGNETALYNQLYFVVNLRTEDWRRMGVGNALKRELAYRLVEENRLDIIDEIISKLNKTSANKFIKKIKDSVIFALKNVRLLKVSKNEEIVGCGKLFATYKAVLKYKTSNWNAENDELIETICGKFTSFKPCNEKDLNDLMDEILRRLDANQVDKHIEYMQKFAQAFLQKGWFESAKKYNEKTLEIDEGSVEASWLDLLISVKTTRQPIKSAVYQFVDENSVPMQKLIKLLGVSNQFAKGVKEDFKFDNLVKTFTNEVIECIRSKSVKIAEANKVFHNIVQYVPKENKKLLTNCLYKMAVALQKLGHFAEAIEFCKDILSEDNKMFDAHWMRVCCEIKCRNTIEVLLNKKNVEDSDFYQDAYASADATQQDYLIKLLNKRDIILKNGKLRKELRGLYGAEKNVDALCDWIDSCSVEEFDNVVQKAAEIKKLNESLDVVAISGEEKAMSLAYEEQKIIHDAAVKKKKEHIGSVTFNVVKWAFVFVAIALCFVPQLYNFVQRGVIRGFRGTRVDTYKLLYLLFSVAYTIMFCICLIKNFDTSPVSAFAGPLIIYALTIGITKYVEYRDVYYILTLGFFALALVGCGRFSYLLDEFETGWAWLTLFITIVSLVVHAATGYVAKMLPSTDVVAENIILIVTFLCNVGVYCWSAFYLSEDSPVLAFFALLLPVLVFGVLLLLSECGHGIGCTGFGSIIAPILIILAILIAIAGAISSKS